MRYLFSNSICRFFSENFFTLMLQIYIDVTKKKSWDSMTLVLLNMHSRQFTYTSSLTKIISECSYIFWCNKLFSNSINIILHQSISSFEPVLWFFFRLFYILTRFFCLCGLEQLNRQYNPLSCFWVSVLYFFGCCECKSLWVS